MIPSRQLHFNNFSSWFRYNLFFICRVDHLKPTFLISNLFLFFDSTEYLWEGQHADERVICMEMLFMKTEKLSILLGYHTDGRLSALSCKGNFHTCSQSIAPQ